jgi:hypothetical protein
MKSLAVALSERPQGANSGPDSIDRFGSSMMHSLFVWAANLPDLARNHSWNFHISLTPDTCTGALLLRSSV